MIQLLLLWLLFFVSHSLLATTSAKSYLQPFLGRAYRLFYNIVAVSLLLLIIFQLLRAQSKAIFITPDFLTWVGWGLCLMGGGIAYRAFQHISVGSFLGLSAADESGGRLITEGVYRWIRHPLYWATLLILIGIFLIMPTWAVLISVILSVVYIIVGIEFEEQKLRATFGQSYLDFAKNRKKFIPFIY